MSNFQPMVTFLVKCQMIKLHDLYSALLAQAFGILSGRTGIWCFHILSHQQNLQNCSHGTDARVFHYISHILQLLCISYNLNFDLFRGLKMTEIHEITVKWLVQLFKLFWVVQLCFFPSWTRMCGLVVWFTLVCPLLLAWRFNIP